MTGPLVDVIIPVHSSTRPIRRAVASVLHHNSNAVSVSVIAHNIDEAVIARNLDDLLEHPRVRILSLEDGIYSPAGPLNAGLEAATTPYVAVMGSDDELQAGAIDSWLALAQRSGSAMVIARLYRIGRGHDAYPPVRPGRQTNLDPVNDRLCYRSAPLGLIERERLGHLRFTENLKSGEDLAYTVHAWFSGHPIAFDGDGPAYLEHPDAMDRVSFTGRTIDEDFAFLTHVIDTEWFRALSLRERTAVAVKVIRTQVFDAVANRLAPGQWSETEWAALQDVVSRVLTAAPGAERLLARVDRAILAGAQSSQPDNDELGRLIARRWNYRSFGALVPRNLFLVFHRQAPFRTLYAGIRMIQTGKAP